MKKSEKIVELQSQIDQLVAEIARLNQLVLDLAIKPTPTYVPGTLPYVPNTTNPWYPGNIWYYSWTSTGNNTKNIDPPNGGLTQ